MAATIWFSVKDETNIPQAINAPPRRKSPKYPVTRGPN